MTKFIIKYILYAFLFTISINIAYGQPPGGVADTPKNIGIDDVPLSPRCVKADISLTYENGSENTAANVMDLNCPGNTNINIFADFDWTKYCFSTVCDFYFQLYICGVPVKRIDIYKQQTNLRLSLNVGKDLFEQFSEQSDLKAKNCDVELRLMSSCFGFPGAVTTGICFRYIICIQGGEEIEQEIPSQYNNTYQQGSCPNGQYVIELICDGDVIDEVCGNTLQYPHTTKRSQIASEISVKYQENHILIDFNTLIDETINIYISDIMGRTSTIKTLDNGNKNAKINLINAINGIYFVNIISDGQLLHSQKVFIQN